jgi:hypothetical protein
VFDTLKEKSRLSAELDAAQQTIETQAQEIARLREAVRVRSECMKELCRCLVDATAWVDPIMVGPVTSSGETIRARLVERINAALTWAGQKPQSPD